MTLFRIVVHALALTALGAATVGSASADASDSQKNCATYKKKRLCEGDVVGLIADTSPSRDEIVIATAGPGEELTYRYRRAPRGTPVPAKLSELRFAQPRQAFRGVHVGQRFAIEGTSRTDFVVLKLFDDSSLAYRLADDETSVEQTAWLDGLHPFDLKICPKSKPDGCGGDQPSTEGGLRAQKTIPAGRVAGPSGDARTDGSNDPRGQKGL